MVGDGPEKVALQERARAEQLNNLIFLPPVEKASVPALMAEADCGIAVLKAIPMFATTYPNKVFDYMASELPVVGAEIGEAIRGLADDPELAKDMGRKGKRWVEAHFDRLDMAGKMEEILLSLS
jgi:glycosyltransferase involved in cell wall biosynthesis